MRGAAALLLVPQIPLALGFGAPHRPTRPQNRPRYRTPASERVARAVLPAAASLSPPPPPSSVAASSDTSGSSVDVQPGTGSTGKGGRAAGPSSPFDDPPPPSSARRADGGAGGGGGVADPPPPGRAPLVDSALLRFLSAQKAERGRAAAEAEAAAAAAAASAAAAAALRGEEEEEKDAAEAARGGGAAAAAARGEEGTATPGDAGDRIAAAFDGGGGGGEVRPAAPAMASGGAAVADPLADPSWLGRYNEHRIAQRLISLGADDESAYGAGRAVQGHALARTMRRRIRRFLRERDEMWARGRAPPPPAAAAAAAEAEGKAGGPGGAGGAGSVRSAGGGDAIGLLAGAGLTGRDVAAILAHTPSVALMRVRGEGISGYGAESSEPDAPPSGYAAERHDKADVQGRRDAASGGGGGGETLEETLDSVFRSLLGAALGLRRYDARAVLRSCPGLLTRRGSRSASQVVTLMSSLGVSASSLARDKASLPALLSRTPAELFRLVAFLAGEDVRMGLDGVGPFLRRRDSRELLDAVAPMGDAGAQRGAGSSSSSSAAADAALMEEFWGGASQARRERVDRIYRQMSSAADFLRNDVGVDNLGAVVAAYPTVLLLNVTAQVLPVLEYLRDGAGLWEEDVPRVIESYPAVLAMDVSRMEGVVEYLLSIEVAEDALGSIFRAFPSLFALDVEEDMVPVVMFLKGIGVSNIGRFVTRLPPVLGYSVRSDLTPKWDYLATVCRYPQFEVVRFPAYFSYPLERVIRTRYEYLRDVKGVPVKLMGVDDVVRFGDADFARTVAGDTDGGLEFAEYARARKRRLEEREKRGGRRDRRMERIQEPSRRRRQDR